MWRNTSNHIASNDVTTTSNDMTRHDMTCHVATNHSSSPHVTSQPTTLLHLTPQATSWRQSRSRYRRGTAESSFTAKKWFGHGAGRSPCAHSIGKFFVCYIVLFSSETSAPGSPGNAPGSPGNYLLYLYSFWHTFHIIHMFCKYFSIWYLNFFCESIIIEEIHLKLCPSIITFSIKRPMFDFRNMLCIYSNITPIKH